ncbi:Alpha/beta hydrolase fold [hydrothermal vent metagenome]|uniref:Alpha/beta hydrolase fold n=1 Tax=hydrothermal vent metagenome TaxID=652676 RepID=A0A1W1EJ28_9ZZZZ
MRLQQPLSLAYSQIGRGDIVLFLHGFGESRYTWRYIAKDLAKDYRLYSLDLKGFGDSPKTEDELYSVYDQAILVDEFIKKHKLKDITIVGHSLGGGVALVLALMSKKYNISIKRLILINTMAYSQPLPSMLNILNTPIIGRIGISLIPNKTNAMEAYKFAFSDDSKIPKDGVEECARMLGMPNAKYAYIKTVEQLIPDDINSMIKMYKYITIPTLIIWGEDDVSIDVYNAYRLNHILPNSQLKVFENVGHIPQEEAPQKVIKEIRRFMKSIK